MNQDTVIKTLFQSERYDEWYPRLLAITQGDPAILQPLFGFVDGVPPLDTHSKDLVCQNWPCR